MSCHLTRSFHMFTSVTCLRETAGSPVYRSAPAPNVTQHLRRSRRCVCAPAAVVAQRVSPGGPNDVQRVSAGGSNGSARGGHGRQFRKRRHRRWRWRSHLGRLTAGPGLCLDVIWLRSAGGRRRRSVSCTTAVDAVPPALRDEGRRRLALLHRCDANGTRYHTAATGAARRGGHGAGGV